MRNIWISIFAFSILISVAMANDTVNNIVQIPRIDNPPIIDGNLDDPIWQQATIFTDFKTLQPDFGLPPSEKTVAYIAYDYEHIYLAFCCFDSEPEKIKASVSRRDNPGNDDWIAFCLDTFNDELGAYFFMVNPLGIQTDGTLDSDADPDITLDMVWQSAGKLTDEGYCAEIAVPFKSLRYPSKETVVMGFKVARTISRKSEEVDFPEYHTERGAALSQFQKIELSGIQQKRIFEILPATTVCKKHEHQKGTMIPFKTDMDLSLTSKFGITSGLIVDATYNPDFSQVEADAGQIDVNLRSALYYPEKRPFFMEGQEWFSFSANPENSPLGAVIHTRSIVDPSIGLKLTGKVGKKNILSAVYAQDEYPKNLESTVTKENAHVSILRYARRLINDSYIGGFYTGRSLTETYNHIIGSDGRLRMSNHSFFEYHGFKSFSKEQEIHHGTALGAIYIYNTRRFHIYTGVNDVSKNFRTDVGYMRRTGVTIIPLYVQYNFFPALKWLQRVEPYYWARQARDKYSGRYESFNVISLRFLMPWQTMLNMQGWLANEVFADHRFSRNAFRFEGRTQIRKQLFLECDFRKGKFIYYDALNPYSGKDTRAQFSLVFQPTSNISSELDIRYEDFYRNDDGSKIYDYTIFRNRTVIQFNKYLFIRSVLEYNTYWKRLNADFLMSFTYIPGTVVYFGYGSVYEKVRWQEKEYMLAEDYLLIKKNFFFKASYLWRL